MPVEEPVYFAFIRLLFWSKITSTNEYVLFTVFLKVVNDASVLHFFVTLEKLLSILRVIYIIQKCSTLEESAFFIGVQTRFLVNFLNFLLLQAFSSSSSFSKVFSVCKVTLIYD